MRKVPFGISIAVCIPIVVFGLGCQAQAGTDAESAKPAADIQAEKAAVKSVIDEFTLAFVTEDIEMMTRIHANDNDMVIFGTDAAEHFVGWEPWKESLNAMFESFDEIVLEARDQSITVNEAGMVAWVTGFYDWTLTAMGEPMVIDGMRVTWILEKRSGGWVICHMHGSMPLEGQLAEY
jgi:ketosteroid isomerase-like protein